MKRLSVEADIGTIVQQGNAGLYPYIIQQTVASTRECEEWPDQLEMHMVHTDCQTRGSLTTRLTTLAHFGSTVVSGRTYFFTDWPGSKKQDQFSKNCTLLLYICKQDRPFV
ncbi:uncharacterized protein [Pocillopora verrucosa]|uniref:uncharacterized protein isoform X4 n=1 Tax=Pocillopora verrucosa TaxID=203993 RepID=UPI00333FEBA5